MHARPSSSPVIYDQSTISPSSEVEVIEVDDCEVPVHVVRFIEPLFDRPKSPSLDEALPPEEEVSVKLENHEPQPKPSSIPFRAVSLDEYEQICKPELPAGKRNNKKRGRPLKIRRSTLKKANASKPKRSRLE
ncbi:hypothetical protein QAD02_021161 [Eretmocerus hayati]|uniref:Uncharacterized protein n=1 Tax=Eretmocerus hayati TaxID=131215 RepID=A0ACC2PQG5_9HYME|nr:hypothetical protein QAD02_021161 [Eretmocerus hayati]